MSWITVILIVVGLLIGVPVMSYMVVKFGAAGYFRAKQRQQQKKGSHEIEE
jgi:hypothetical protein